MEQQARREQEQFPRTDLLSSCAARVGFAEGAEGEDKRLSHARPQEGRHALQGDHGRAELGSEVDVVNVGPRKSRHAAVGGVARPFRRGSAKRVRVRLGGERFGNAVGDGLVAVGGIRDVC